MKRITLLIALLLTGCAQSLMVQGKKLVNQGEYDRAIETFYQEIATHPRNLDAWRELGVAFYKSGDLIKAEDALKKASKEDPGTHLYLGLVLEARNEYDKAISSYTVALSLQPDGETRSMIRSHLDYLVHKKIDSEVASAIENESAIDAASIPENTIAVVNFDGSHLTAETAPIARGLAELTAADLAKVSSLRVVERLKIEALQKELELGASGQVDVTMAPRMGRLLGSSHIVTGSALSIGEDAFRLDGAIVNTGDSSFNMTEPVESEIRRLFEAQKNFVFGLLDNLGVQMTAEERDAIRKVPTESYLAFLAYCRGLDYRSQGMMSAAQTEFQEALQQDANFGEASQELQSVATTMSRMQLGEVTTQDLEAAAAGGTQTGGQRTGRGLSAVIDNSGAVPSGTSQTNITADSNPEIGGTGRAVVRGNLDGD